MLDVLMKKIVFALLMILMMAASACARVTDVPTATPPLPVVLPADGVPAERVAAAKAFVDQLTTGDYKAATATFTQDMLNVFGPDKMEETWQAVLKQVGAFLQQTGTHTEQVTDYDIVYVSADFENGSLDIKIVFDRQGKIAGLYFVPPQNTQPYVPPTYVDTTAFAEQKVTIGEGEWAVPGTLTLPKGDGPFPAVVLVHGSGPNDRDESIGPNKPFRDLAWGLASNGVAVLRYEKRTYTHRDKFTVELASTLTVKEETIDDAVAAVALLRQTTSIDPARVYVLGHSLGGMLLPRIAAAAPETAGLIYMAAAARPLEDIILEQTTYIANLDGILSPQEQQNLSAVATQAAQIKDPALSVDSAGTELPLGIPPVYWLDLRDYDPPQAAAKLSQPMLLLQGERDYQVTQTDFDLWKAALSARSDVTFHLYPKLNHLFIAGEGRSNPSEYNLTGHVEESAIRDILSWLQSR
jgi:dienelactone hydrolase